MKRKVLENQKEKYTNLLKATSDLLKTKSIHHLTIADIVKKAGVAKGTFYLYFKDKYQARDTLILQQTHHLFQTIVTQVEQEGVDDFVDSIIRFAELLTKHLLEHPDQLQFIEKNLSQGLKNMPLFYSFQTNQPDLLAAFVAKAEKNGFHYEQPEIMLTMVFDLVGMGLYKAILFQEPCPVDDYLPYLKNAVRAILN